MVTLFNIHSHTHTHTHTNANCIYVYQMYIGIVKYIQYKLIMLLKHVPC